MIVQKVKKGPGDVACKFCLGEGIVAKEPGDGVHPRVYSRCACAIQRDIADNVERGMAKLLDAPGLKKPSFMHAFREQNLWVTAEFAVFTAHLRWVATRQPPTWYFKVVTDANLMTAWLASVALKGDKIYDPDVLKEATKVSTEYLTLVDLVMPPDLLVIQLGTKVARNEAMPEVFLEALNEREAEGKPTWVWDTPSVPLAPGHRCFSSMVAYHNLANWKHKVRGPNGWHEVAGAESNVGYVNLTSGVNEGTGTGLSARGASPSKPTLADFQRKP